MTAISTVEAFGLIQDGLAAVDTHLRQAATGQLDFLRTAIEHLLNAGGKRIRPAICLLAADTFAADFEQSVSLAAAIEMLHTATLVHDDLIDESPLRRGSLTFNAACSPDAIVLAGDYLFARAANLIAQTNSVCIMDLFAKTLMIIVNAKIKQKFSRGPVSREEYYERIYAKTGAMFVLSTEAATVLGGTDKSNLKALREFGRNVGMAYQIMDDALNFCGDPDQIDKPVGGDLRQGLFTLPAIYYVQAYPDDPDIKALLNGNVENRNVIIPRVVAAVCGSGAVTEAMQEAREFVARAQLALEKLPDSTCVAALSALSQYIVDRDL